MWIRASSRELLLYRRRQADFVRPILIRSENAKALLQKLARHQKLYEAAYNALNDELIKAQIEESVLKNIKEQAVVSLCGRSYVSSPTKLTYPRLVVAD